MTRTSSTETDEINEQLSVAKWAILNGEEKLAIIPLSWEKGETSGSTTGMEGPTTTDGQPAGAQTVSVHLQLEFCSWHSSRDSWT